ncbi:hypothetical protein GAZ38_12180 [Bacteroides xylanisolvens]|uniref:Uncharacterized protein n=1 Tax=Bacteroides xylanisolvens TaxID=371601 RepID=A0A7J5QND6_9BACE|nr:hypothetical protein GAZ38_12180 [Bacteroides xylanisolvens]KAB6373670.1 hypothetical protein GAZ46_04585 [Bacteroides xylanisolvens]KAB6381270.1 hypothetical protein GAZ34_05850 [Bacteroides xylanisolvens]KAB6389830.1 hypothetical protein GAZ23_16580 [Bacteroides xylanisolvens]KAB6394757.1 hypothetical protein GAZ29_15385 [Bacteroides xylanisolvens]
MYTIEKKTHSLFIFLCYVIAQNPTIAAFIFIIANPDFIIANFIFIIANQHLLSRDSWFIEMLIVSQIYDKSSGA